MESADCLWSHYVQNEIHALNFLAILEIKYTVHAADTLVLSMTIYGKVWCMPFRHLQIILAESSLATLSLNPAFYAVGAPAAKQRNVYLSYPTISRWSKQHFS
ncbi:hypothetical protein T4C_2642 [Trichinella pseudospiralis]|uniref:Uncharacterized protein n=1 Tax=Trichinella pseudospiralis TaxID=6337 RepID=A0A0V1K0Y4_TRIPS|nr:hypothetical protein T4C_2642 [Trichinella pseudospiralis]